MTKHLTLKPFIPEHVLMLGSRAEDRHRPRGADAQRLIDNGIAQSAFDGDELIMCGGIVILHPGVAEAWLMCKEGVGAYKREVYVYSRRFLDLVESKYSLHRIQAHVRGGWKIARMFLEHLGFHKEGLLEKFGPDQEDYYIYARIG